MTMMPRTKQLSLLGTLLLAACGGDDDPVESDVATDITADADAAHQYVVRAMDAAGQMGFVHLSITTREPAGSDSGG